MSSTQKDAQCIVKEAAPDSWKNIPKCLIETIKALITLSVSHESQLATLGEFHSSQDDKNLIFEKRFTALEANMGKEIEGLSDKFTKGITENLQMAQDLHCKADERTSNLSVQLREQNEKLKRRIEDGETQREALVRKIGEIEIKLFKQRQEMATELGNSISDTKKELTNCPGLYGDAETCKSLGNYLTTLRKEMLDKLEAQAQEFKLEITIESSKMGQRLDSLGKSVQETAEELVKSQQNKVPTTANPPISVSKPASEIVDRTLHESVGPYIEKIMGVFSEK